MGRGDHFRTVNGKKSIHKFTGTPVYKDDDNVKNNDKMIEFNFNKIRTTTTSTPNSLKYWNKL